MNTADLADLLAGLHLDLGDEWTKQNAPAGTTTFTHPDGHHIGLRAQKGGTTLQAWITAGPTLPQLPDAGSPEEKATARAANDDRLQPGRTWHAVIHLRHTSDPRQAAEGVLRDQLLPALTNKPRNAYTLPDTPKATSTSNQPRNDTKKKGTDQ